MISWTICFNCLFAYNFTITDGYEKNKKIILYISMKSLPQLENNKVVLGECLKVSW